MRKIFTFLFAALMSVGMWADPNIVTPTISGDLSFTESTTVTMECTSPNSDIYYTTDGVTDPRCDCAAAPEYTHPITITETTIIKAAAYDGNDWSAVAEVTFTKVPASDPAEVTVVFAANNKTVERTVTLPHTFKCSWDNGMDGPDELDIIIHELYNDYYYCNSNMNASGSDQVEVGTEEAPKNDYITIKGVFEGTATVTGDYFDWITGEEGEHNYSITISIKGDEPQSQGVENVQTNQVQATKFFRDGQLLIEKNGKLFNVTGAQVK